VRADVPAEHRAEFDDLLAEARMVYRLREERAVFGDQWALGIARRGLLAAGERLVARGRLQQAAHLVEATWAEVQAVLRDEPGAPSAAELAERARYRQTARFEDVPQTLGPPPGPPLPLEWLPPLACRMEVALLTVVGALFGGEAAAGTATVVRGVGVAAGSVEGPARIVGSSSEFGRVREGDVLVTRGTTSAFNIVLPLVAGIVTDRGGMLCHAAIVAREYGIPAVVGCGDATARIADGTRVRVDGATGEVTILG
jgi:pyruvate,water dikinase